MTRDDELEDLIEEHDLATVLAIAAMRLPPLVSPARRAEDAVTSTVEIPPPAVYSALMPVAHAPHPVPLAIAKAATAGARALVTIAEIAIDAASVAA